MTPQRTTTFATFCLLAAYTSSGERIRDRAPGTIRGVGGHGKNDDARRTTTDNVKWHPLGSGQQLQRDSIWNAETISNDNDNDSELEGFASSASSPSTELRQIAALSIHSLQDMLLSSDRTPATTSTTTTTTTTNNTTIPPTSVLLRTFEPASFSDGMHSMFNSDSFDSTIDSNTDNPTTTTTTSDSDHRHPTNPRTISNAFHTAESILNSHRASDMLWAFGQFLNHDISEVNTNNDEDGEDCDIPISKEDDFLINVTSIPMKRSKFLLDDENVAQQLSDMTSLIDGENLYGTTASRLKYIRAEDSDVTGRLRTSSSDGGTHDNNLLPKNTLGLANRGGDDRDDLFLAGDGRANENVALLVVHTLWMREHNYWADSIRTSNPTLRGDEIFQMARVLVRAIMQKIVYAEFLPALLGEGSIPQYTGYKSHVNPGLENIVTSCVYRLGHTMVGEFTTKNYDIASAAATKRLSTVDSFFAPHQLEMEGGLDPFLRGLSTNACQEIDPFLVPSLRNHLFGEQFDLMALNIERARDHGIPDFNTIRSSIGYTTLDDFDDFLFSKELASVYDSTDDIDCWIGMNAEPRVEGSMVGPTQRMILAANFANIRDGDVEYYENSIEDEALLSLIEGTSFADVIRRNSDVPNSLDDIQDDVFFVPQ